MAAHRIGIPAARLRPPPTTTTMKKTTVPHLQHKLQLWVCGPAALAKARRSGGHAALALLRAVVRRHDEALGQPCLPAALSHRW